MAWYHNMVNTILAIAIVGVLIGIAAYWALHFAKKFKEMNKPKQER